VVNIERRIGQEVSMIDHTLIEQAVEALHKSIPPGSTVILFGSYAQGTARPDSDVDFLVIEPEVEDSFAEMVRLSRLLGRMLIPADVWVMSRDQFHHFKDMPHTIACEAWRKGKMYEPVS
jgi:predicted nucleotidyltransferase